MAITKRTVVILSTDATKSLRFNGSYGRILKVGIQSSADTSAGVTAVDAEGETIFTWASADYTTRSVKHLVSETAVTQDGTTATTDSNAAIPVAKSPLTLTPSGLGSGTLTVDIYVESAEVE
jgi:hypothetical protein